MRSTILARFLAALTGFGLAALSAQAQTTAVAPDLAQPAAVIQAADMR